MASERPWRRAQVRSPAEDETFVAVPELHSAADAARRNRDLLSSANPCVQGRSLSALREWTRRDALAAAVDYTAGLTLQSPAELSAALPDATDATWYVGGHQPILFHPGVWVKNFVVAGLARTGPAIGLNLVVDNDILSTTAVRVPVGGRGTPRIEPVLFDEPHSTQPWEEARIVDRSLFASFPNRVAERISGWGYEPMIGDFWPVALRHSERSDKLSDCLTAARAQWERRWGFGNLELPLSRMCRLEPFLWFVSHILAHLPRFHAIYNQVVHEYRQVNRLRSRTHPVPDLRAEEGGWFETPFWIWHEGDKVRQRLLARQDGNEVRLSNGAQTLAALPLSPAKDACCAVKSLQKLQEDGWRLRTRALTTTLFSRLCLADLFVHGLGGAKYDEMTDRLIARFFRLPAPEFVMLSATVRLPLGPHPVQREDERRLRRQLRELEFHSERSLPNPPPAEAAELAAEKSRLVAAQNADGVAEGVRTVGLENDPVGRDRYRRFQAINRRLAEFTLPQRRRLIDELARTVEHLSANSILEDREYAFCLYPADKLYRFMNHVCSAIGS